MISNNIEYVRAEGRRLGLTASQVQSSNFGVHTISALKRDIKRETQNIYPNSFEEMNPVITTIRPTPERVRRMFQRYQGLDPQQIEGLLRFGMTRLEVTSPNYSQRHKNIEGIHNLPIFKNTPIKNIISLADNLEEYRLRGLKLGMSADEVGIHRKKPKGLIGKISDFLKPLKDYEKLENVTDEMVSEGYVNFCERMIEGFGKDMAYIRTLGFTPLQQNMVAELGLKPDQVGDKRLNQEDLRSLKVYIIQSTDQFTDEQIQFPIKEEVSEFLQKAFDDAKKELLESKKSKVGNVYREEDKKMKGLVFPQVPNHKPDQGSTLNSRNISVISSETGQERTSKTKGRRKIAL